MKEHELCCGTVADKSKLCSEIAERDSVIRTQQRRIGQLLQERDEALAYAERLRGIKPELPPYPGEEPHREKLPRYGLRWNGPTEPLATPMLDGYWTPYHMAAAIKAKWQAEALENAIRELPYCGYDGQAWASELEQYALKLRTQEQK